MAPTAVTLKDTAFLLKNQSKRNEKPLSSKKGNRRRSRVRFKVGDVVRVAKENMPFKKGYQPQFTEDLYRITRFVNGSPITYTLETFEAPVKIVLGKFYQPELVKFIPASAAAAIQQKNNRQLL